MTRITRSSLKSLKVKTARQVKRIVWPVVKQDPRYKDYPEDLEGLTEGERKLMKL